MGNKIHSVKYNFIMNFILTASSFIFPLITFPYVSRVLLAEGNGKVAFATSVASYFTMVASLGIPTYGVRACAKVRDNNEVLSKTAQEILIINFIATLLVTITYLACIVFVPRFAQDRILFLICGTNIVLNVFGANWIYQALEQYDYITARSIFFKILSVVLMFTFIHEQADYRAYAAILALSSVGSNILNFIRLRRIISFKRFEHYDFRKHLKPIFILFAQSVTVSIYTNLDTVMLGFMKNDRAVGLYNAAVKIKAVLLSFVSSLSNVLLPRMSYYVKKADKAKFLQLMSSALNAVLFMSLPLSMYFVFESKDAILFLAGEDYLGAIAAMQIITVAVIPNGLTGVLGVQVLTPLEKEKYVLYSVIVGAVSDFVLNCFMIPLWGPAGAALATTIAEFLVLFTQIIFTKQLLRESYKEIHIFRYLVTSIIALVPTIFITRVINGHSFIRLLITAIVFFGVYGIILILRHDELMKKALDNKIVHKLLHR